MYADTKGVREGKRHDSKSRNCWSLPQNVSVLCVLFVLCGKGVVVRPITVSWLPLASLAVEGVCRCRSPRYTFVSVLCDLCVLCGNAVVVRPVTVSWPLLASLAVGGVCRCRSHGRIRFDPNKRRPDTCQLRGADNIQRGRRAETQARRRPGVPSVIVSLGVGR